MSPLVSRFLAAQDLLPDRTWELLEWCAQQGANEFSVAMLSLGGSPAPFLGEVDAALNAFQPRTAPRKQLTVLVGQPQVQSTKLWALAPASIALLKRYFSTGLFTYPTAEWNVGWLEDPTFYRDGYLMLGIVSHEQEGMLTLTEVEHAQVAALGIPTRDRAQWI